jgi:hypothetical protein
MYQEGKTLMQVSVIAGEHGHHVDVSETIKCALAKPSRSLRQKQEMLKYLVLLIALMAVLLLISIALYYTQGNSVSIEHVSSLAPHLTLRA